jgi:general secretion pathway protein E
MAQRLIRTLCPHCKVSGAASEEEWQALVGPWKLPRPKTVYHASGCLECRMTGFRGRTGLYEMLPLTPSLKKLVTKDANIASIKSHVFKDGMQPLRLNGAEKVAAGLTTIAEVLKVAPAPLD